MAEARKKFTAEDIPVLPGFVSVAQAAKLSGRSKAGIFYLIYSGKFRKVYRLGGPDNRFQFEPDDDAPDDKPYLIIEIEDLKRVIQEESEAKALRGGLTRQESKSLAAWHRRIKDWAQEQNIECNYYGPPGVTVRKLYVESFPNDTRPVLGSSTPY